MKSLHNQAKLIAALSGLLCLSDVASAQPRLIRVAQARVPAGSASNAIFNANVMGVITSWTTSQTAVGFYGLNAGSFGGPVPLTHEQASIFFADASDGLAAFCVYDRPGNLDGGHAQLTRYVRPAAAAVEDLWALDQQGAYCWRTLNFSGSDSRRTRYVFQNWGPNETEGWGYRLNGSLWTSFQIAGTQSPWTSCTGSAGLCEDRTLFAGLNSLAAVSSDGTKVTLTADQRAVQFQPVATCEVIGWPSQQSACFGGTIRLGARPNTTGPVTFTWFRGTAPLQASQTVRITTSSDGLTSTLEILGATTQDAGTYSCLTQSSCGSRSTQALSVTVGSEAPTVSNPFGQLVACGDTTNLSVDVTGSGPFTYQWYVDGQPAHDVTNALIGTDQRVLSILNANPEHAGAYHCVVTNACGSAASAPASVLVVQSRASITENPVSTNVTQGGSVNLRGSVNSQIPVTYRWQVLLGGEWQNLSDGTRTDVGDVQGATTPQLRMTGFVICERLQFRLVATNACGCAITSSATVTPIAPCCDSIDFNNNGLFPEDQDVIDFFAVLAGGVCSTGSLCGDIDTNNDGLFPDDQDIETFFRLLAGGSCR